MSEFFMEYLTQNDESREQLFGSAHTAKFDLKDKSSEHTSLLTFKHSSKQSSIKADQEDREFASQTEVQTLRNEIQELKNRLFLLEQQSNSSLSGTDKRKLLEEAKYQIESSINLFPNGIEVISTFILNAYNIIEGIWKRLKDQTGYEAQTYILLIYSLSAYLSGTTNPTKEQLSVLIDIIDTLQTKREFNTAMIQFYNQILLDKGLGLMDEFI